MEEMNVVTVEFRHPGGRDTVKELRMAQARETLRDMLLASLYASDENADGEEV
jgi:hypothetical protein